MAVSPDAAPRLAALADDVQRFIGPCLISNRLSNGKGAHRVFLGASSGPVTPSLPGAPPSVTPLSVSVTGAPLISWQNPHQLFRPSSVSKQVSALFCTCLPETGAGASDSSSSALDLSSMGVGLIAVDSVATRKSTSSDPPSSESEATSSSIEKKPRKSRKKKRKSEEAPLSGACLCKECSETTKKPTYASVASTPPPSYCYLSIIRKKTADEEKSAAPSTITLNVKEERTIGRRRIGSGWAPSGLIVEASPGLKHPIITISVPPNCHFIPDDDSVRLSTSVESDGSGSSRLHSPSTSSDSGRADDSSSLCSLDEYSINTVPPPDRQWAMFHRLDRDRPVANFTVMCYNVLCDKYATTSLYSYCPSWALNWEYRKKSIMQEIRHYDCDIISLQEVETEQFHTMFLPELEQLGYAGSFSPKSRAKTMSEDERKYVDGCAIFWKVDKFELDKKSLIEFTQLAIAKADGNEHMLNRVMTRDNIALAAVLKIKEGAYSSYSTPNAVDSLVGSPLLLSTAHIHWDPEFCDVKLVQTMMLIQELTKMVDEVATKWRMQPQNVPVLICGDLNSMPQSGVFEFITKGRISSEHEDLKQFRGETCLQKFNCGSSPHEYTHHLRLESAYESSMMPFTNFTLDFKGIIDYIFGTPQTLCRLGVIGPVEQQWLSQNKIIGCPHPHIPSDHVPLLAQYALIPPQHQRMNMFSSRAW